MLVKFLSYVVSIIGARRYKPIFISLAVLTLTVTGVTMIASALSNGSYDASSSEQSKTTQEPASQPSSSDLKGLSRQQAKDESRQSVPKAEATTPSDTPKPPQTPDKQPGTPVAPELTLSGNSVSIQSNGTHTLTATTTSNSTSLIWAINSDNIPGLSAVVDQKDQSATIRLKAENATHGVYQVMITLKDSATGLSTQKTLQVTIAQ